MDKNNFVNDYMKTIDQETKMQEYAKELSQDIAKRLIEKKKIQVEIGDKLYNIGYTMKKDKNKDIIFISAIDNARFKLLRQGIFKIEEEVDTRISFETNMAGAIEAFIRHILDIPIIEELD